ncbi:MULTISPECIES: ferritin-like domain-containing protein [unclassified Microcoleus]|uniref:ferritin-like domain-containing protein n=1 Tax=unclassified Microcoleus TaxID=2642155 RepID=UPI002FCFD0D1
MRTKIDSTKTYSNSSNPNPLNQHHHVKEVTKIQRPPNGVEEVPVMLSRLLEAHELIIGELRIAIDKTSANQDSGTNDLLASQALRTNETQVWFLAEHLVDTPLVHS